MHDLYLIDLCKWVVLLDITNTGSKHKFKLHKQIIYKLFIALQV